MIVLISSTSIHSSSSATPPVIPGADGYGAKSIGGRGGQIYRVTNLNSSGSGSLRNAIEATGSRTVIFEVSGTINFSGDLIISNPYITIAGQTAPSPGITIKGANFSIRTHSVLVQHLRFRVGDGATYKPENKDAISVGEGGVSVYNVYVDHCSFSWGIDENMSTWYSGCNNITFRYCIVSEALHDSIHPEGPHSMGLLIGGETGRVSIHNCLLAHNNERNPQINPGTEVEFVNNVIFDWGPWGYTTLTDSRDLGQPLKANFIGNYYKMGINSQDRAPIQINTNLNKSSTIYVQGNIGPSRTSSSQNEWDIIAPPPWGSESDYRVHSPAAQRSVSNVRTGQQAYDHVLANAGARPADRDAVDNRIINDVRQGTGTIINSQNEVGGWPSLSKKTRTLNLPSNPQGDNDGDGYTNLEEWLHQYSAQVEGEEPASHSVSKPNAPSGSTSGSPDKSYSYSSGGASCTQGHSIQYLFDWGDGSQSSWSASNSASHTWSETGSFTVEVRARCANDTSITSDWSSGRIVTISSSSHYVSAPAKPTGPAEGNVGSSYSFSAGEASCSQGHGVQYRFDWGDSSVSSWSDSQHGSHSWNNPGTYTISAQARCAVDLSIVSQWTARTTVIEGQPTTHNVSTPNLPSGPAEVNINKSASFSTGGALCSSGHSIQYRFDWGDGTTSSWSGSSSASHTWSQTGSYKVKAQARCANDNSVISGWSSGKTITISQSSHLVSAPDKPSGPYSGKVGTSYSISSGGSFCSQGHSIEYRLDWGDGSMSSWSDSRHASHIWSQPGSYAIQAQARCASDNSITSQWAERTTIIGSSSSDHTVSTPTAPTGSSNIDINKTASFSSGGSSCSEGHSIQYRFDWGDGTVSSWSSSSHASHSWRNAGSYSVRTQARCTSDINITSGWSSQKTVQIVGGNSLTLQMASVTEKPAPGLGGNTSPGTGSHAYSAGSAAQIKAIPNPNYRFQKWSGDVAAVQMYDQTLNLAMNQSKSLTAHFATKCGDINGDLAISPTDSQVAFDIFLGLLPNPTFAQRENADVNCDGTKTNPYVSPTDAQAIFEKYLGLSELPGDCSCKSRSDATSMSVDSIIDPDRPAALRLKFDKAIPRSDDTFIVPLEITGTFSLKAFGLDLQCPSNTFEFIGIKNNNFSEQFVQIDANQISENVLRIGGYSQFPIEIQDGSVVIQLIFKTKKKNGNQFIFQIIEKYDDLRNAVVFRNEEQIAQ